MAEEITISLPSDKAAEINRIAAESKQNANELIRAVIINWLQDRNKPSQLPYGFKRCESCGRVLRFTERCLCGRRSE